MIEKLKTGYKSLLLIVVIFLLGFFLRTYKLDQYPVGFHNDEVSIGVNAYSLLKTLRDKNGNFLPFTINQFGDYRPAGYLYFVVPSIKLFGLNEFSVRFPGVLFGALSIIFVYFFAQLVFKNKKLAFLSALILAFSPWHINLSRASSESVVSLFFVLCGFYFYLEWLTSKKKSIFLIAGLLLLIASYFFYHSARIFVPLVFLVINFLYVKSLDQRKKIISYLAFGLVSATMALAVFVSSGFSRPAQVSIFNTPHIRYLLEEQIREDHGENILTTRLFHNKVVNYASALFQNFGSYITIDYLFISGGFPIRYQIPSSGLLYLVDLPFFLIGLFLLLYHYFLKKNKLLLLPIIFFLTGLLPAVITTEETPNIVRSFFMVMGVAFILPYGIIAIQEYFALQKRYFYFSFLIF